MLSFKKDQEDLVLEGLVMLHQMCEIEMDQFFGTSEYQKWEDKSEKVLEIIQRTLEHKSKG